jgi:branched-subunit amino acid transport protein AzlD
MNMQNKKPDSYIRARFARYLALNLKLRLYIYTMEKVYAKHHCFGLPTIRSIVRIIQHECKLI